MYFQVSLAVEFGAAALIVGLVAVGLGFRQLFFGLQHLLHQLHNAVVT
jgi:hypothetical protein